MQIITLTTDLGSRDHYPAVLAGRILSACPTCQVIGINHDIPPFNIVEAAYQLRQSYRDFPESSLHIAYVNNDENPGRYLAAEWKSHLFIGPDNGLLSLIFDHIPEKLYRLEGGFLDLREAGKRFGKFAAQLADKGNIDEIGERVSTYVERIKLHPVVLPDRIRGSVIHIDPYGNVVVNIHHTLFDQLRNGRNFEIQFKRAEPINRISETYTESAIGETLCIFNSSGYLELAINLGHAASQLDLKPDDTVLVQFKE